MQYLKKQNEVCIMYAYRKCVNSVSSTLEYDPGRFWPFLKDKKEISGICGGTAINELVDIANFFAEFHKQSFANHKYNTFHNTGTLLL